MDKIFYSLEEAAQKLGKSTDEVRQMAARGQLQEFRDRDRLMFKREQVDLLAGEDEGMIPLASDSGELSLSSSGTGMKAPDVKESSAISIFEAETTDESDANAVTRVGGVGAGGLADPGKSGSGSGGLLDLTKEADDTSLGAGLIEDVLGAETVAQQTAAESPSPAGGEALFEAPGAGAEAEAPVMPALAAVEPYDGTWSGIAGGLALGSALALGLAAFVLVLGLTGTAGGGLVSSIGDNFFVFAGVAAGLPIVFAVVGMMLGRRS
jgi:hypothetical protein